MSRRDLSGAVDFDVLDRMTGGDDAIAEEVLGLFAEQGTVDFADFRYLDTSGPAQL